MDFDKILDQLTSIATSWGLKVVGVLVVLLFAWIIAGWVHRRMTRSFDKRKFDVTLGRFFAGLAKWGILTGAILGCLGVFGIQTASFAAVIAAAGLAIGLAFQGSLANFAAGVMLLVFRPFKVGDLIKVAGELGFVEAIDLFTVELKTLDNRMIIVPNKSIFGSNIENITGHPIRRVDVDVGVEYGADLDETRKVLETAIPKIPGLIKDEESYVFLKGLGASSVDYQMRVWCKTDDYWDVYQATIYHAKKALDDAGMGIPFPQVDVHFDNVETLKSETGG